MEKRVKMPLMIKKAQPLMGNRLQKNKLRILSFEGYWLSGAYIHVGGRNEKINKMCYAIFGSIPNLFCPSHRIRV